jgi:3-hydroxyacyl-CoA dehydrogenase
MTYLIGIIVALFGALVYTRGKQKTAEAINENVDVKTEVQKNQAEVDKNNAVIASEEEKREEIKNDASQEKTKSTTDADIINFFNKLK